jgi:protein-tyrosine phosphatase
LVHCNMGVSRSAAAVTAFLMYKFGHSVDYALGIVTEGRFL